MKHYVSTEVEVDLSDFSDDELIEELESRSVKRHADAILPSIELYEMLRLGKEKDALDALRIFVMNDTGRIL